MIGLDMHEKVDLAEAFGFTEIQIPSRLYGVNIFHNC